MPIRANLLTEIGQALGAATTPALTSASAANDVYEAYLFSLVLEAAKAEGAAIRLECIDGGVPTSFIFRSSPGYLNSRAHNYGYAVLAFANCPVLEAHVGVRVSGHSGVLHECDISVLFQREADVCRSRSQHIAPRSSQVVVAIEAKFYAADLGLHLGRGFLGLVRDTSAHNTFFVINRSARSVERLLAHKRQQWEHHVLPTQPMALDRFRFAVQKAFHNFVAKYRP